MTALPIPGDQLLDHVQALRAIALRLLRDAHAVDDVVQDTVVQAMTRPAPRRGSRSAWLAAILRNTIRQRARADRRRTRREADSFGASTAPSAADAANELTEQRRLLAFVQELGDAQRQAVFLHFWRGLTAREIATELKVPTKTIHSRLERGLAQLRVRLDGEPGGRDAWVTALAGFAELRPPVLAAPTASAVLIMKNKLLLGASALALLVLTPWIVPGLLDSDAAPAPLPDPIAAAPGPHGQDAEDRGLGRSERTAVPSAAPTGAPAEPTPPLVQGFVRDLTGAPIAGIEVVFERMSEDKAMLRDDSVPAATSDREGRFALPLPVAKGRLSAVGGDWTAVLRPWLHSKLPAEPPTIVVAPTRSYSGMVVDANGYPVAKARVTIDIDESIVPTRSVSEQVIALPGTLDSVQTDARGQFAFASVGYVEGARIVADLEPMKPARLDLPEASAPDLLLRLGAPDPAAMHLHGVVLDGDGAPLPGALVAVGGESVESAADGRFSAPWAWGQRPTFVRAAHPEHGAAQETFETGPGLPGWRRDNPLTIRLPAEPGVVSGRVVSADGQPLAGVRVWTPDVTYLGTITREEQGHQVSGGGAVEAYANDGSAEWTLATVTDERGAFTLRGLLPRSYAFFAMDPQTLNAAGPHQAAPGDDVEIALPTATLRRVAGRAVSEAGHALAGLRVSRGRGLSWKPPHRDPDPWAGCPMQHPGAGHLFLEDTIETDAEGRFEFAALATEGTYLWFAGDSIFLAPSFRLQPGQDPAALEVVLPVRSTFRVELLQPGEADGFRLEQDGKHRTLLVRVEGHAMSMGVVDLINGVSPQAYAAAGAATVVLTRGDEVVRKVSVTLPEGAGHALRL